MTSRRLSARSRLTALYTALFAASGSVLVTVTYLLLAANLPDATQGPVAASDAEFAAACAQAKQSNAAGMVELRAKCASVFQQGVKAGASAQRESIADQLLRYSVLTLVGVTLVSGLLGWLLAGRILRPVHQLTEAARAATEHTLTRRLALTGPHDELRELADTFDEMLARLDAAFASQRRFIANASHELRTPLTVMRTTIDVVLAKPSPTPAELAGMGADVRHAVGHAEALIDALLTLARNERGLTVHERVDLAGLAEDVLQATASDGMTRDATLHEAVVTGDPVLLERLVVNLVDNAGRYNVPSGLISVRTWSDDATVGIEVRNSGPVVPVESVPSLFEPFTRLDERTERDGAGLGLGLALVSSIAAVHGATVSASAPATGGLDISVRWAASPALS